MTARGGGPRGRRRLRKVLVGAAEESLEAVEEGEMPPWFYLPVHRDARPSEADRALLRRWARPR